MPSILLARSLWREETRMPNEMIYPVPLKDIRISDDNVRSETEADKDLQELADSIKRHGQLQPVILIGEFGEPKYDLIVGQRRFLAHKFLGKREIKATFVKEMSDTDAKVRSLAENMCRVELTYKDAADAITALYKKFGRDDRKVARETGLSLQKIRQYIYIEERASAATKQKLRQRKVQPVDVHRALQAASDDVDKADQLLERMQKYDKYQKQRMVEYGRQNPKASVKDIEAKALEPTVERKLVVKLSDKARSGLAQAAKKMSMEPDELAAKAVEEWLATQGFI
jgi:ParB family transcriptional regulator, chromosome partitioning protein